MASHGHGRGQPVAGTPDKVGHSACFPLTVGIDGACHFKQRRIAAPNKELFQR